MSCMTNTWLEMPIPDCPSYNCTVLLLVIYCMVFNLANACLSQSGCRKESELTLSGNRRGNEKVPGPVDIDQETTTKKEETHKKDCTPKEVKQARCMNKGICFVIEIFNPNTVHPIRTVGCHCKAEYEGKRCQYQAIPPDLLPVTGACVGLNKYVIVIIAVVLVAGLLTISCATILYCKHIRKKPKPGGADGGHKNDISGQYPPQPSVPWKPTDYGFDKDKDINHNHTPTLPIKPPHQHGQTWPEPNKYHIPSDGQDILTPMLNNNSYKRLSGDPQLGYYEAGNEECRQWHHFPISNFETNL